MVDEKPDPIEIRLNAIIRLLSESLISQDKIKVTSVYRSLDQVGLSPKEIGSIFGIDGGNVSSAMSKVKKQKTVSKKKLLTGDKNEKNKK